MAGIINAMSVDVEDYFQVSAFESHIPRQRWESLPWRVEANTTRILDLFDEAGVKATFFTLGWVAERFPALVRRIVTDGHELASHGYDHRRATDQAPPQFYEDVVRTKGLLEEVAGVAVKGYRATSYSIGAGNLWALDQLRRAGYRYSSSIYPIRHDHYGIPDAPRFPFHCQPGQPLLSDQIPQSDQTLPSNSPYQNDNDITPIPASSGDLLLATPAADDLLLEIPISTVLIAGRRIPCGGGGYFRLFPYRLSRQLLRRLNCESGENDDRGRAAVFYFHPWELDPGQPRQKGLPFKTRFRHYLNLKRMESRLRALLHDFHWDRMDRVFAVELGERERS
ncbi:MAG: DUF3473 domain-containing protein [Magnetococcales bacterium]|nr:DUF3473 domain-containing protein [Magnetococcales bacterium]